MFKAIHLSTTLLVAGGFAAASFAQTTELTPPDQMPAGAYKLDPTHASVTWKVNHLNLSNYTARFTKMDATLNYDPKDPTKSTLSVTIDPASVKTDFPNTAEKDFDAKLGKGEDWFDAGNHPAITYTSTRIEKTGEKTGKIHGDLTFLGVTKPLVLDVVFNGAYAKKPFSEEAGMGFSASSVMKRSLWGFDTYIPVLGDDVALMIEAEFGLPAAAKPKE